MIFITISIARHSSESSGGGSAGLTASQRQVDFLQINDIYELTELSGVGGPARVATVRAQVEKVNPGNVMLLLAGDYISPSVLASARINGSALAGRQMVDVLNFVKLDVATLGNHEFDVDAETLRQRLAESAFKVVVTNGKPSAANASSTAGWSQVLPSYIVERNGIKLAFVGCVASRFLLLSYVSLPAPFLPCFLPSFIPFFSRSFVPSFPFFRARSVVTNTNNKDYFPLSSFDEAVAAVRAQIASWRAEQREWDVLVALTHQYLENDAAFAEALPEVDLVLGGHEHENFLLYRAGDKTRAHEQVAISKADANSKSLYHHSLVFDKAVVEAYKAKNPPPYASPAKDPRFGAAYLTRALTVHSKLVQLGPCASTARVLRV